jgi:DNA-binding NarL/FixJ family response regulator
MEKTLNHTTEERVNILLVGNNPIELSKMQETVLHLPGRKVFTEIAFDLKSIWQRLLRFKPNYILIDDNIGKAELSETVVTLTHHRKTRHIPITVLKNSNYLEALATNDITDYVLKKNLTTEALYNALKNSLKFRRTRQLLKAAYHHRKRQLLRLTN